MNTENLSTLKIHKLSQSQYDRELEAGRIDENALYLTPDEVTSIAQGGTGATNASAALSNLGALPCASGAMTGEITLNGIVLTPNVDYGDTFPTAGTVGRMRSIINPRRFSPTGKILFI